MTRAIRLSPQAYRRITFIAAVLLAVIIVTGGAVRLTGSGLGCPDWPNCSSGRLTPESASDFHGMVEFVNRLVTGLVSVGVIVAVLGSLVRVPRRRDLIWLSLTLVVGVIVQIVLGKLVVDELLAPPFVMAHFLVSMVLLANAILLHRRAGQPAGHDRAVVSRPLVWMGGLLVLAAAVVVVTGTVVTGAGPHSGDVPGQPLSATRLDLYVPDVARVHGTSVIVFLGLVLVTLYALWRFRASSSVQTRLGVLLAVLVAQAGVGYAQYFNDIPPLLVGIHIAGATAVWAAVIAFYLGLFSREQPAELPSPKRVDLAGVGVGLR